MSNPGTAWFWLRWGQGHDAIGMRSSWSRTFYPALGTAVVVMGASGMGPGEGQDKCFSPTPSTLKPAFDHPAWSWAHNPQSVPQDSKTWESLNGQLPWQWRKANSHFQVSYICKSTYVHWLANAETAGTWTQAAIKILSFFFSDGVRSSVSLWNIFKPWIFLISEKISLRYWALRCSHQIGI